MLRRIIDLSLKCYRSKPSQHTFPPPFPDYEELGPERSRTDMQSYCKIKPYQLGDCEEEIVMDITMGHSTPHTHVDVFMHDWYKMFEDIPREHKWAQRDVSQVPVSDWVGEASLVDLSDFGHGDMISLKAFKERAEHLNKGDIVLVRTGHPEKYSNFLTEEKDFTELPLITKEIAKWLVEEKRISVYGHDAIVNGNGKHWMFEVESYFYRHGVLMIDGLANLNKVSQKRFFATCGLSFKFSKVEDSPARVVAIEGDDLLKANKIDLFKPINITLGEEPGTPPYRNIEPWELRREVFGRLRTKGFHFSQKEYGIEDLLGFVQFKTFSSRAGTHIEIPFESIQNRNNTFDLENISSEKLIGSASVIEVNVGPRQNITTHDLESHGKHLKEGDIAIIQTGFTDNYYHNNNLNPFDYTPGFKNDAIKWLADKGIKMLITDTLLIEENAWKIDKPIREGRKMLFEKKIPIVTCATNIWRLQKSKAIVLVSPIAVKGVNTSPVRVVAIEEWE